MQLFINEMLSSIIQIVLFTFIPFIWWVTTARKHTGFMEWIGLKRCKVEKSKHLALWITGTIIGFWIAGLFSLYLLRDVSTAASLFAGLGFSALPAILIYAVFHTALSEEILFRGFLLKRISAKFGFRIGNAVQALLFGFLHGAMFVSQTGYLKAALLILFTGAIAWVMGYINERKTAGSILPSWIIHGITNIISGASSAFFSF